MEEKGSLFAKMARIMGRLGRIEKRGKNQRFNYEFVTSDDVADAIREAMAAENVAFFASQGEIEKSSVAWGNGQANYYIVNFEFTFADGDTGDTFTCHWRGEAIDNQDKTIAKAATAAEKYFLLKTFIVSTGDDPDPDSDGTQSKAKAGKAAKQTEKIDGLPVIEREPVTVTPPTNGNSKKTAQVTDEAQPSKPKTSARPYDPESLRKNYAEAVTKIEERGLVLGPDDFAILENAVQHAFETGDQSMRYLEYVTGTPCISDLGESQIIALLRLWRLERVNEVWTPFKTARTEIASVLALPVTE